MKKFISTIMTFCLIFTLCFSLFAEASIVTYDKIRLTSTQTAINGYTTVPVITEGLKHGTQNEWEVIKSVVDGEGNDGLEIKLSNNNFSIDKDFNITPNMPGVCVIEAKYTNPDLSVLTAKIAVSMGTGISVSPEIGETEVKSSELSSDITTYYISPALSQNQVASYEFWFYDNMTTSGGGIVNTNDAQWGEGKILWYFTVGVDYTISQNYYYFKDTVNYKSAEYYKGVATSIKRTKDWHQFYVDASRSDRIKAYLDGVLIYEKECTIPSKNYIIMGRGLKGGSLIYKNFRYLKAANSNVLPFIENSKLSNNTTPENGGTIAVDYSLYCSPSQTNPYADVIWQKSISEESGYSDITASSSTTLTVEPSYQPLYYRARITPYSYHNSGKNKNTGATHYTASVFVDKSELLSLPEAQSYTISSTEILPKDNSSEIEADYGISFTFDSAIAPVCVTKDNFYVYENKKLITNYELVQSYDKKTVAIRFPDNMKYGVTYEAYASKNIRSDVNHTVALKKTYSTTFRTKTKINLENATVSVDKENLIAYFNAKLTDDVAKDSLESLTVIGAMYSKNGQLISTQSFPVSISNSREINLGFSLPENYTNTYTFKLFAWENDNVTPLCENIAISSMKDAVTEIFVSPNGNDSNSGSINSPLKTLKGARDKIRLIKSSAGLTTPITVYFREGVYPVRESVLLQNFYEYYANGTKKWINDSGTAQNPITYRAYMDEEVVFDAGIDLDISNLKYATASDNIPEDMVGKVRKLDISGMGLDLLPTTGEGGSPWNELVVNDKVQNLARYPDKNDVIEIRYSYDKKGTYSSWVNNGSDKTKPHSWKLPDDNTLLSLLNKTDVENLWCEMSIDEAFVMQLEKIGSFNTATHDIALQQYSTSGGTAPTGGESRGYYLVNSPAFINTPGEYYIDRENEIIYFYTDEKINSLALTAPSSLIKLFDVSYITFKNFTFRNSTRDAISTISMETREYGTKPDGSYYTISNTKSSHLIFDNLKIMNVARGINLTSYNSNGNNPLYSEIKNCTFYGIAGKTIEISAGNKYDLTSSEMRIFNNHFENLGRINLYQSNAVRVHSSVGGSPDVYIGYNKVNNTSDMTFWISAQGIIENNEIYDAVHYGEDTGAIYVAGATTRGKIIRNNYIHDIKSNLKEHQMHGIHGIYLDVYSMSSYVYNNILENINNTPIKTSGGGRNHIYNNVIILDAPNPPAGSTLNIKQAPIAAGDGGSTSVTNEQYHNTKNGYSYPEMHNNRNWLIQFPEVVECAGNPYPLETSQKIYKNLIFGKNPMDIASSVYNYDFTQIENNTYTKDTSIFENFDGKNYQIKEDASGLPEGFQKIDMSDIGLITDKINAALGDGFIIKANSPLKLTKDGISLLSGTKKAFLKGTELYLPEITKKAYDYYNDMGYSVTEQNGFMFVNVSDINTLLKENSLIVISDLLN